MIPTQKYDSTPSWVPQLASEFKTNFINWTSTECNKDNERLFKIEDTYALVRFLRPNAEVVSNTPVNPPKGTYTYSITSGKYEKNPEDRIIHNKITEVMRSVLGTQLIEGSNCDNLNTELGKYLSLNIGKHVPNMTFQAHGFNVYINTLSDQSINATIKNGNAHGIGTHFRDEISDTISNLFEKNNIKYEVKHSYKDGSIERFEKELSDHVDSVTSGSGEHTFFIDEMKVGIYLVRPAISPMVRKIPKALCRYSISNTNPNGNIEKQNSIKEGILQVLKAYLPESKYTMEQVEA